MIRSGKPIQIQPINPIWINQLKIAKQIWKCCRTISAVCEDVTKRMVLQTGDVGWMWAFHHESKKSVALGVEARLEGGCKLSEIPQSLGELGENLEVLDFKGN